MSCAKNADPLADLDGRLDLIDLVLDAPVDPVADAVVMQITPAEIAAYPGWSAMEVAKKGKVRSRKNAARDAHFHLADQGLQADPLLRRFGGTSVTSSTLSPFYSSKVSRTWRQAEKQALRPSAYRRPAPWSRLADLARETWWTRAVAAEGGVPFTANFSHEEEAAVRAAPKAVDRLRREIDRQLKAAFGRAIDYMFRLEQTHGTHGRLHAHGSIIIDKTDARSLAKARRALRRAFGEWTVARQHQVRFGLDRLDEGWTTYTHKDAIFNKAGGVVDRCSCRGYQGKPSYATNGLKRKAVALYNEWRDKLINGEEWRKGEIAKSLPGVEDDPQVINDLSSSPQADVAEMHLADSEAEIHESGANPIDDESYPCVSQTKTFTPLLTPPSTRPSVSFARASGRLPTARPSRWRSWRPASARWGHSSPRTRPQRCRRDPPKKGAPTVIPAPTAFMHPRPP